MTLRSLREIARTQKQVLQQETVTHLPAVGRTSPTTGALPALQAYHKPHACSGTRVLFCHEIPPHLGVGETQAGEALLEIGKAVRHCLDVLHRLPSAVCLSAMRVAQVNTLGFGAYFHPVAGGSHQVIPLYAWNMPDSLIVCLVENQQH